MTTDTFDIAIIGGGVIGLSIARALKESDAKVAVIDRGASARPATIAAAGMLAPSFESAHGSSESLYAFGAHSLGLWRQFAEGLKEDTGLDIDFREDGVLGVALNEEQARTLVGDAEELLKRGAEVEQLHGQEIRDLEPALSEKIQYSIYAKNDAQVDPRKTLIALQKSIAGHATQISHGCSEIHKGDGGKFLVTLDNGEMCNAQNVVLATGVVGNLFQHASNIIYPVKGEATALAMPDGTLQRVVRAPGAYLCPKSDDRLIIGATELPHQDDDAVDDAAIAALKRNGAAAAPSIAQLAELERWSGLRPATPDGAPVLGKDPRGPEGLFLALGHHRNGVLLAPATAEAMASALLGAEISSNILDFRPDRFAGANYG